MSFLGRSLALIAAAVVGAIVGLALVRQYSEQFGRPLAYPHVVPKTKDVVALRFAMVHDVLHERFPKHGAAYYQERNRVVRKKLDGLKAGEVGYESLIDDLAVGLEFTGDHDGAIRLLREKLKRQLDRGDLRPALYSTYANLGTFLILGPFRKTRPGNADDKATLREGLGMIRTAVEIRPDSHFGREAWQAAIIEYMIALHDDPETLLKVDMIGNKLGEKPDSKGPLQHGPFRRTVSPEAIAHAEIAAEYLEGTRTWETVGDTRAWIATVRRDDKTTVPFDEPTLGIVGMWRLGGGAHPYFAVALGETMLRVNQRFLAWDAFERAGRMAESAPSTSTVAAVPVNTARPRRRRRSSRSFRRRWPAGFAPRSPPSWRSARRSRASISVTRRSRSPRGSRSTIRSSTTPSGPAGRRSRRR